VFEETGQTKVNELDFALEGKSNVVGFEIPVQAHAPRNGTPLTIGHGIGNGTGTCQNLQIGKLFLFPKAPPSIPNSRIVTQHLRQRPTIQPLQHHKPNTLGRRPSPFQTHNIRMAQFRMNRYTIIKRIIHITPNYKSFHIYYTDK
jgi:hypothetical protein